MARRNSLKDDWKFEADLSNIREISIDSITLPSNQPRHYFDPQKLQQLKESISTHGILEPLLVRPVEKIGQYELVAGERRYRAQTIARLKDEAKRKELLEEAITQNLSVAQIRERLKAARPPKESPQTLKQKMQDITHRFQRAKAWDDPKKQKRLEKLLRQMETLLAEN